MGLNPAVTSPQYTKLHDTRFVGGANVSLCDCIVVFAGQINSDLTTPQTWAQFNYNNVTVGAYANVYAGMTLLIGTVNDITKATFRGRTRLSPSATIFYSNESSADFVVGNYFWVICQFEPWYKLARPVVDGLGNVSQLVDFEQGYQAEAPCIVGLQPFYGQYVDGSGIYRIAFDVSASYSVHSGASISNYNYTILTPTGGAYSIHSGSVSSPIVTIDFHYGEFWVLVTAIDSTGVGFIRQCMVKAHDPVLYPPNVYFEGVEISGDITRGFTASLPAFAGVDNVLDRTMVGIWRSDEMYGSSAGTLTSQNVSFVGWLDRESNNAQTDPVASATEDAHFDVLGIGPAMARMGSQGLPFTLSNSPSENGQILNLTPMRAEWSFWTRYTTVANLCDVRFDSHDDTYLFPDISAPEGGVLQASQAISAQIDALIGFAPWGNLEFAREVSFLNDTERAALTEVASFTNADATSVQRSYGPYPSVGKVNADGAYYNPSTGIVVKTTIAPGHAQGEGDGSNSLSAQILASTADEKAALAELTQRSGNKYSFDNMDEFLDVEHTDGFIGINISLSRGQVVTWTLDTLSANGVDRIVYDTTVKWTVETVSYRFTPDGTWSPRVRYRRVPGIGAPGDDTTQIAENEQEDLLPDLGLPAFDFELPDIYFPDIGLDAVPPAQLLPPPGKIATFNGSELIEWSATKAYYSKNFIALKTPQTRDVTPDDLGSYQIKQIAVDPFYTNTAIPAYLLASDGTNSAVWYTPNIAAGSVEWTKGANISGVYTVMRATNTVGGVLIYSAGSAGTVISDPMTTSFGSNTLTISSAYPFGVWGTHDIGGIYQSTGGRTGGGCSISQMDYDPPHSRYKEESTVAIDLGGVHTVTAASLWGRSDTNGDPYSLGIYAWDASKTFIGVLNADYSNSTTAWRQLTFSGSEPGVRYISFFSEQNHSSGKCYLDDISVTFDGGSSTVCYSSDHGATFSAPITVGATPGTVGGFDVQRAGTISYAAAAGAVYKATTLGGAYSSWYSVPSSANPVCAIIPYYRRNSTTRNTSVSDPDVVIACDNGKLYWINGTTATATDITPSGVSAFDNANCVTTSYGHHLTVFGKVSGTYHLFTSTDGGATWADRGARTSPTFIRDRRNDTRAATSGTNKGQLYLADGSIYYSSAWASGGMFIRNMPSTVIGLETIH